MQARKRAVAVTRRRPNDRTLRVIRQLCEQRALLQEEVRQLSAAVHIYRELAERSAVTCR
jgi:hypothetical protein